MLILLQKTMQAILNAEIAPYSESKPSALVGAEPHAAPKLARRRLHTRLGLIRLRLPVSQGAAAVRSLFTRYSASETNFLLLLGRIIARARATPETVRDMAQRLCGHDFDNGRVATIVAAIDRELADYLRRELEGCVHVPEELRSLQPRQGRVDVLSRTHFTSE